MVLRDLDVLTHAARRVRVSVHVSIMTLDATHCRTASSRAWRPPLQRLRAVRELVAAGIDAGVAIAPILPGLTDGEDALAALVRAAREAGATRVWGRDLYLRGGHARALPQGAGARLASAACRATRRCIAGGPISPTTVGSDLRRRVKRAAAAAGIADRRADEARARAGVARRGRGGAARAAVGDRAYGWRGV